MVAGQNIIDTCSPFSPGDLVVLNTSSSLYSLKYDWYHYSESCNYPGVIISVPDKYLSNDYMVSVLMNGKISWYMPNEILKIGRG